MTILLIFISVFSTVTHNCLTNSVCKERSTGDSEIQKFNMLGYIVCIFLFGLFIYTEKPSFYSFAMGVAFGVVTAMSSLYRMKALNKGPMHLTLLITASSMIIPTASGIFFGEDFSINKLFAVFFLIGFIYLSLNSKSENENNTKKSKWLLYCILAFLLQGSIGVLQKVHQFSIHKNELNTFLFSSFLCSAVFCKIGLIKKPPKTRQKRKNTLTGLFCGACVYAMNIINLKLSGIIPSQLFFPLINGSSIILSSFLSVVVFKEKLTKKQLIGLSGGILSLIAICIV